eukprot:g4907.t1
MLTDCVLRRMHLLPSLFLLFALFSLKSYSQETPICDYPCVQSEIFDVACGGVKCTNDFTKHPEPEKLCTEQCLEAVKEEPLTLCVARSDPFRERIDLHVVTLAHSLDTFCLEYNAVGSLEAEESELDILLDIYAGNIMP